MKLFQRSKKPSSNNPDINKSLLQGDAGLGMQAARPTNPTSPTSPSVAVKQVSTELDNSKHSDQMKPHKKEIKEGYEWDFCIVLPNPEHEDFKAVPAADNYQPPTEILQRLHDAGLQTYQYYSGDWDEIFIKVRAPLSVLRKHAQKIKYKMLLDSNYLKRHVENIKAPIGGDINHTRLSPYDFIYGSYVDEKRQMFAKAPGYDHPFSTVLRIKLILDLINNDEEDCCNLNLRRIVQDGSRTILHYYPLHEDAARDALARNWFGWRVYPWLQPLDDVKEYVGEKIGLYFAFTGHYTTWLVPLCIASLVVILYFFALLVMEGNLVDALSEGFMVPFFCIFVAVWAQLMLEYWKRKQNRLAMEWGQTEFEEEEDERPEFEQSSVRPSLVDGHIEKYFNPAVKLRRMMWSTFVITGMILLVIACVSLIFYLQYYVNSDKVSASLAPVGNAGVSILSAVQIIVLNMYYSGLAIDLNNNENHRTDTEYDDALIGKLYVFMFVNSYAALFFLAFIKTSVGEKCQGPCMVELAIQLTVVFASQLTVSKVSAYFEIVVNTKLKAAANDAQRQKRADEGKDVFPMTKAEIECQLEDYDPSLAVIADYSTIVIQYGYVTLFVAACPLAPMLAYLSNYAELRLDGYKLLRLTKRPIPTGAEDIGTWGDIMQITSVISVVTNAALVCYTMKLTSDYSDVGQLWLFIGFQYTIFITMAIFAYVVDDIPEEVQIQLDRMKYLVQRAEKDEATLRHEDDRTPTGASRPVLTVEEQAECVIHRTEGAERQP